MKVTSKIAIVLASVVAAASITGVSATWYFSSGAATSDTEQIDVGLGDWDKKYLLLNTIIEKINDDDSGLNECFDLRDTSSATGAWARFLEWVRGLLGHFTYENRTYYGSMDTSFASYVDSEISSFLSEYENYSYIIDFTEESSNKMYVYISDSYLGKIGTYDYTESGFLIKVYDYFTNDPGTPTVPIGANRYHIYRTTLNYNSTTSEWEADSSATMVDGYAPSCWYEDIMTTEAVIEQIPSYDIANWQQIDSTYTQGASDTAIWTFNGDSTTVTAENSNTSVYFQLQTTSETYNYTYSTSDNAFYYYGLRANGDSSGTINNYFYNYTNDTAGSTHEYKYNEAGTYTITSDSNVEITVYESSINGSVVGSGTGSATFTAAAATTYYIVLSGATEMSLSVELA